MSTDSPKRTSPAREKILPAGVRVVALETHPDRRGSFTEVFRAEWNVGIEPVQWDSIVTDRGGVLRGVKVHLSNDHLVVPQDGRLTFGLKDLRRGSPTEGAVATLDVDTSESIVAVTVPRGVAHGFYFHEPSVVLIGNTSSYDVEDQQRVYWADPALGIPWPAATAVLSDEDEAAPPLSEALAALDGRQPT